MSPAATNVRRASPHGPIQIATYRSGPTDTGAATIVLVHGWPDSPHSWRHQVDHLTACGHRTVTVDVRGYGRSSRPDEIAAYRLRELADDILAVADDASPDRPVVLIGHDWGAPIVWNAARLRPERVAGVLGMSVPYRPVSEGDPMELWDAIYADRLFYMRWIHPLGAPEASFGRDLAGALRRLFHAASGLADPDTWFGPYPPDADLVDVLPDPGIAVGLDVPEWMAEHVAATVHHNADGALHGWFHRYRAQRFDADDLADVGEPRLGIPAAFVGGEADIVRRMVPGIDLFAGAAEFLDDPRGVTLIEGVGHWVQQEAPTATNQAIDAFLASIGAT